MTAVLKIKFKVWEIRTAEHSPAVIFLSEKKDFILQGI